MPRLSLRKRIVFPKGYFVKKRKAAEAARALANRDESGVGDVAEEQRLQPTDAAPAPPANHGENRVGDVAEEQLLQPTDAAPHPPSNLLETGVTHHTGEPQPVVKQVVLPIDNSSEDIGDVIVLYHDSAIVEPLPPTVGIIRNVSHFKDRRKQDLSVATTAAADVVAIPPPTKTSGIFRVGEQPGAQASCNPPGVFKVSSMVLELDQLSDASEENNGDATVAPVASNVQLEPCTMKDVEREVTRLISNDYWTCIARGDTIVIMYGPFATHNIIVQRAVTVDAKGVVSISVHNEPLPPNHDIWGRLPPVVCLEGNDPGPFSKYVSYVVTIIRWYEICRGIPVEERYAPFVDENGLKLDSNPFQEKRYTTAYRTPGCLKLINVSKKQLCHSCKGVMNVLDRKIKRRSEREGSPPANTNYRFLSPAQRLERMEKKKRTRQAYYVKKKIQGRAVACHIMAEQINHHTPSATKKKKSLKKLPEVNLNMCHPGALLDSII
ncbi:hypothetical protein ONE63_002548 [Megalurothrips usitatus]|uniref:Uncharacterized protein n=1 Tax=Megalurothrips usitatus TaxID=439358 RepID=A0AAV7XC16_9NEOP|nr:hypothetical protein ONE63_002548 [Megalurothrips usitatus]